MASNLRSNRIVFLFRNASFATRARAFNRCIRRIIIAFIGLSTRLIRIFYDLVFEASSRRIRSMIGSVKDGLLYNVTPYAFQVTI